MSVIMRIIQQYEPQYENEFMALEKKFHELEKGRPDFPKGKRMQPISSQEPTNSLIWQYEFPDMDSAYKTLSFFKGDDEHELLFKNQVPYIKNVRIEFFNSLEFN